MDLKTIDFINYHSASYVNEFISGDSTTRARIQEILTSFGKQLIDCYSREGKETPDEQSNCIKPAVIKSLPTLEEGMILEYKDLTGRWYEYTKDLQENIHFEPPLGTRVRRVGNVL